MGWLCETKRYLALKIRSMSNTRRMHPASYPAWRIILLPPAGIFLLFLVIFPQASTARDGELLQAYSETGIFFNFPGIPETESIQLLSITPLPAMLPQSGNQRSILRRRRTMRREQFLGIGGNLLGPTLGYASVFLQYAPGKVIQAETGADMTTVYGGLSLYPKVNSRVEGLGPYMGLMLGYSDPNQKNLAKGIYAYMPIGIRYVTIDDWYVSFEVAATTASSVRSAPLFMGIKLGYLFRLN